MLLALPEEERLSVCPLETSVSYTHLDVYKRQALEYLDRLGLKDWAHHMPNEMSGGQKQRVAIARALITRPQIILADEPTGALDSKTSVEVMQILKDLHRTGMTIVVVTHESGVANQTDKIIPVSYTHLPVRSNPIGP